MATAKLGNLISQHFANSYRDLRYDKEIGVTVAYRLLPIEKKLTASLSDFEKIRNEIYRKYARKNEKGDPIIKMDARGESVDVDPSNADAVKKELDELFDQDVHLPDPVVKVSEVANCKLNLNDLSNLVGIVLDEG